MHSLEIRHFIASVAIGWLHDWFLLRCRALSRAAQQLNTSKFADIGVSLEGHVAVVEIQRPPLNFFDQSLIKQIADAFDELDDEAECRAIVLASEGKAFCAGANFGTGQADGTGSEDFTEEGFQNVTGKLYAEATRLFNNKKPIVGAIQGAAIGGGLGLALVPDFRVASPAARFGANFVKLGIHQGFGITVTLPRVIGLQAANNMLMTGRRVSGVEALDLGLIDQLVEGEQLRSTAILLAQEIAENAPLAVMSVRATLRSGLSAAVQQATLHELAETATTARDRGCLRRHSCRRRKAPRTILW